MFQRGIVPLPLQFPLFRGCIPTDEQVELDVVALADDLLYGLDVLGLDETAGREVVIVSAVE